MIRMILKVNSATLIMKMLGTLLSIVNLLSLTSAAPSPNVVVDGGNGCSLQDEWFAAGKVYTFSYTGAVETRLDEVPQSGTETSCDVIIHKRSNCWIQLQLRDCRLQQSFESLQFDEEDLKQMEGFYQNLQRYPVYFLLTDEGVEQVKVHEDEPVTVTNFKRGIISILPTIPSPTRMTVHGRCPVARADGFDVSVDLSSCSNFVQTNQIPLLQNLKVSPFAATLTCSTTTARHSQLQQVTCEEIYTMTDAINDLSLKGLVRQQLRFRSVEMADRDVITHSHRTRTVAITYDPSEEPRVMTSNIRPATSKLEDVISSFNAESMEEMSANHQAAAAELVTLTTGALVQLWGGVKSCAVSGCNQDNKNDVVSMYLDALVTCGTEPCLSFLVTLLQDDRVSSAKETELLYNMALTTKPNHQTITPIIDLCSENPRESCLIPASIMANRFITHNQGIYANEVLISVITMYKNIISRDCSGDHVDITSAVMKDKLNDNILASLKSIENLADVIVERLPRLPRNNGPSFSAIKRALSNCVTNPRLPHRLGASALRAVTKMNPSFDIRTAILVNTYLSPELRAMAFKQYVKQGDPGQLSDIIEMVTGEENSQLRMFALSTLSAHLATKASAEWSPVSTRLQGVISEMGLSDTESKSWSYNHKFTESNAEAAADLDYSVLYKAGSLVPGSSLLNLTFATGDGEEEQRLLNLDMSGEGWDFTSGWELSPQDDLLHIHDKLASKIHELQLQIQRSQILPSADLDLELLGIQLVGYSLRNISFWRRLSRVVTNEDLEQLLNLRDFASSIRSGVNTRITKANNVELTSLTVPSGLGVPLTFSVHASLAGKLEFNVGPSNMGYRYSLDQVIRNMDLSGHLKIIGHAGIKSTISAGVKDRFTCGVSTKHDWGSDLTLPLAVRGDRLGLEISISGLSNIVSAFEKRSNGEATLNSHTVEVDVEHLRTPCMFSWFERLTGLRICKSNPAHQSRLAVFDGLMHQFTDHVLTRVPEQSKQLLVGLMERTLSITKSQISFRINIPDVSNKSSGEGNWSDYFSSIWGSVRQAFDKVPKIYSSVLFGDGNIITYDGKMYTLPENLDSECAHVLTRDFQNHKFTVLKSGKGTTILASNNAITVNNDYLVEVNNTGIQSDLPIQTLDGGLTVIRQGSAVAVQSDGFKVSCDNFYKFCTFSLSGWFHNRTLGLLGTNDNEVCNEFKMRTGTITSDTVEFVNSYEVSGLQKCRLPSRAPRRESCPSSTEKCLSLFTTQNSPLQSCFSAVNPAAYFDACKAEMESCIDDKSTAICSTAQAYINVCSNNGVNIQPLDMCGSCQNKRISDTWQLANKRNVDIVIVKPHGNGYSREENTGLFKAYIHGVKNTLRKQLGVTDLRLGFVSYGGEGGLSDAHSVTTNGEVFTTRNAVSAFLKTLERFHLEYQDEGDSGKALNLALNYPFRAQASKIILLVNNGDLQVSDLSASELKSSVTDRGVSLQVISKSPASASMRTLLGSDDLAGKFSRVKNISRSSVRASITATTQAVSRHLNQCSSCTCSHSIWGQGSPVCHSTRCA